ncbi:MAG: tRNA preQ1(34) S-adenosylmethionine ribosyltransferase-isomerase QueA [Coprobacillus sp.]|nr:tRNA preQ1(34) S-adenosylmethionine ribosyltransferase-isomerase QueA [Coprobacillus sp.]MDY4145567.1 tRNA preQ1(34) S-adenosylmethionine ribosyltransferase-isomerase QueA [Bacilli bacterium]OLA10725.1 MAG: tRNA preQ1(34) S-adenosylmethionine ribosyltransferase-isomerase QueA [Coprobacillus sp. 28_7]CCY07817.1 s-adenosylmethionine:tRNA ribosyltransferase-isomerase [Coprobacillus sp. CAG:698]
MKVEDFDYNLPLELIAQTPLNNRSESKLMVVDKKTGAISHHHFYEILDMLTDNDVLVLNDTKVLPSRIYGKKVGTDAHIEMLLLKDLGDDVYEVLARPGRRLKVGTVVNFGDLFTGTITEKLEDGIFHVKFTYEGIFLELLDKLGEVPLPPYIHEKLEDKDRYQTVYAKNIGSAAAPTAGLHFTKELLDKLKEKGVTILYVTLHIGLGTFRPVQVDDVEKHHMHTEKYFMSQEVAEKLNEAKKNHKRIISVGTTSTRTLESIYTKYNTFKEVSEETNIFIYPGYEFKAVDGLITNFHLPKSTLIMLVSALCSREIILNSYEEAIKNGYRFFSFGDAQFIR